jgi:transposase
VQFKDYRTLHGAEAGDLFMSLIHTCELSGANPFDYLAEFAEASRGTVIQPGRIDALELL